MTNEEQKLREIEDILADIFTAGGESHEVGGQSFDQLKQSGYIDRKIFDLTALISENYVSKEKAGYPKEFVEWIGDDCSPCYLGREEDDYGKWVVFKRGSMEHEAEFDTLDELFSYWKENEQ